MPPGNVPTALDQPADGECAVQLVRTLSCDQFDGMPQGEKGILEAYLRGIASAKDFIYLETQYFTNDAIGDGLVNALLSEPQLKVIVLLNIEPDVPDLPVQAAAADHPDPQGDRPDADRAAALRRVHALDARGSR